jgi:GNAT superfamily N-acetyltransferase
MSEIHDYQTSDYAACLDIFASNVPLFFAAHEGSTYSNFLGHLPCPYLACEWSGSVVGAGGYYLLPDNDCAGLVWGMVARDHQRRGIGTALLQARLLQLAKYPNIRRVRVKTSQRITPFFQHFGFQTERIVEHHFGPGVHQYEMFLYLAVDHSQVA